MIEHATAQRQQAARDKWHLILGRLIMTGLERAEAISYIQQHNSQLWEDFRGAMEIREGATDGSE